MKLAAVIAYLFRCEIFLVVANYVRAHESRSVPASLIVHWNSSNPIFHIDNTYDVIDARIRDQLNIICPKWPMGTPQKNMEYAIVYRVNKTEYENCLLLQERNKVAAFCNQPDNWSMNPLFTISLLEFTPNPKGMEFLPNNDYYFISTSDGTQGGISNRRGGLCKDRNMRIRIRLLPRDANDPRLGYSVTVSESTRYPPPFVEIINRYDNELPSYDLIPKGGFTSSSSNSYVWPQPLAIRFLLLSILVVIAVQTFLGFR